MVILDYESIDGRLAQCQSASRDELLARVSDGIDSVMAWAACWQTRNKGSPLFLRVLISRAHLFQPPANNLPHFLPSHAGALIRMLGGRAREVVACGCGVLATGRCTSAILVIIHSQDPPREECDSSWLGV